MPLSRPQIARKTVQEVASQHPELSFHGLLVKTLERLTGQHPTEEVETAISEVITRAHQAGQEAGVKEGIKQESKRDKTPEEIYAEFKLASQKEFFRQLEATRGGMCKLEVLAETILRTSELLGCRDPEVSEILSKIRNSRAAVASHMPWNKLDAQS